MKLLYITATLPYSAGIEDFFIPEVKALAKQCEEIIIFPRSLDGVMTEDEFLGKKSVCEPLFSMKIFKFLIRTFLREPRRILHILSIISRDKHVSNIIKNIMVFPKGIWAGDFALRTGVTHIHAQWAATTATMALVAGMFSGIEWSFTAHRGDIAQDNMLGFKCGSAKFVRLISEKSFQMTRQKVPDFGNKAEIIHMGVDVPADSDISSEHFQKNVFLCPASFLPVKGHKFLMEAGKILTEREKDFQFLFAGDGPLRSELEDYAARLGINQRVSFLGHLPQPEVMQMYKEGKVGAVVLPSVDLGEDTHEGIPVVLFEAMSYGIPVISTCSGGIPELLSEGAGIMVPHSDAPALADAMENLLGNDVMRKDLSEEGRERVIRSFSAKHISSQLMSAIKEQG
jgi:glycosyltransferase involved in cell wall biosynthesis